MKYLWVAIASLLIASCSALEAPSRAIHKPKQAVIYYNDAWMKHQNAKLVLCYTKMPTMQGVNWCLIKMGVYI